MSFLKGKNYSKFRKSRNKGIGNSKLFFCRYGLKSISRGRVNKKQLESARKILSKNIKNNSKIVIRIYPDIPLTKKPIEVRMGSGKGDYYDDVFIVKPGTVIFEFNYDNFEKLKKIFYLTSRKFPFKTALISRYSFDNLT
ncbi:50S ribosomal protein L16 [Candidatus Vidania fulgoroideorum]